MTEPNLENKLSDLPRAYFAALPTPLMRLANLEKKYNHSPIVIKRDDMTGLGPGGNKLRSLEFLAGEAINTGCDTLIASGPVQSNLCTLTAAACANLGLKCLLVHNGEKPAELGGNLLLNELLGAESHFLGNVSADERNQFTETLAAKISSPHKAYIIRNGATSGCGALGYVNAVSELKQQFLQQNLPKGTIFAPGGNGGVASGLIYGNALLGMPFQIIIISVEDDALTLTAHIEKTIEEIEEITGIPFSVPLSEAAVIDDSFRGEGWGYNTAESHEAVLDFPKAEGILIEHVYNSKVLVGMEHYLHSHAVEGTACYLHTGGFGSLFAQF